MVIFLFFFFFGCTESSLLPGLSLVAVSRGHSSLQCEDPHCSGFSCGSAQALGAQASVVVDSIPGEGTKVPRAAGCGHIFFLSF